MFQELTNRYLIIKVNKEVLNVTVSTKIQIGFLQDKKGNNSILQGKNTKK